MRNFNSEWSSANQQYLALMIKLLKDRLSFYAQAINDSGDENVMPDFSQAEASLQELASNMSSAPAIEIVASTFQLTPFEKSILLLCAGIELDASFGELIANIQGDGLLYQPTFGLALAGLPDAHWSAVSPGGPLRYWRLIEMNRMQLVTRSSIRIDEHILHYLTGIRNFNEKLREIAEPVYVQDELVPSQLKMADQVLEAIKHTNDEELPIVQLYGTDRPDKIMIASNIALRLNSTLYTISAYSLPVNSREVTELARLWSREAALNGYVLFLDCTNLDISDKPRIQSLISFIENIQGLLILNSDQWTPDLKSQKIAFDIEKPTAAEQLFLWETVVGQNAKEVGLGLVVSQFNLSSNTIRKAGFELSSKLSSNGTSQPNDISKKLWKICCNHTRPQVDELAQRIEPVASWEDIVLPPAQLNVLREIAVQVRQRNKVYGEWGFATKGSRGLGISAMFTGESGTGKTMASEVLANELGLDLYKIDLSKVVNKYIGETEKNLKRIFDAAEEGGAILLFDEADALFGKRSDVKDSHDRYSNIEVSYLLQRMEAYRGLAILTTNMKNSLDKAFLRRIRFVIHFPFPDALQRAEIWRRVFPAKTPTRGLDLEKLSKLTIPGGSIRNIALNAAFSAADECKPVEMSHILRAARSEYEKTERPFAAMN